MRIATRNRTWHPPKLTSSFLVSSHLLSGIDMIIVLFLRRLLLTIWFFFHTMACALVIVLGGNFTSSRRFFDFVVGTMWARPVLWLANVAVDVRGAEHWPLEQGSLVLFNHTSWMDILVMSACLPRVPRFGAKIELFWIPFFGRAMKKAGMLPIERRSRTRVLQVYKEAEARAALGECFALAPEGTRQHELRLGKFKQGPFLFALGAQIPVIPVVISGAREVMPKTSLLLGSSQKWRSQILVEVGASISTQGLAETEVVALQERVRQSMTPIYDRLNQELGLVDAGFTPATHLASSPNS